MTRPVRRLLLALVFATPLLVPGGASGAPLKRAAVVVQHGDFGTKTQCVKFRESKISGYKLLQRSRFKFLAARYDTGRAVCWLDGEGCKTRKPSECFACDPVRSWSYWTQDTGGQSPQPSGAGISDRVVRDGSIDYWVWGPFGLPPLPPTSIAAVCGS